MVSYQVDENGFPIDPELRRLEYHLAELVDRFYHPLSGNTEELSQIVAEYHQTMEQLHRSGWDNCLDIEFELPYEYLPTEYLKRCPRPPVVDWGIDWSKPPPK